MKNRKFFIFVALIGLLFYLFELSPVSHYFRTENIMRLREWVMGFGNLSFVVYTVLTVLCCIFLVPIVPIAMLATLLYGASIGFFVASFATTLGSFVSFLIARYYMSDYVKNKTLSSPTLKEMYDKTEKYGFIMLIITRLIPVFPFGIQNYVYGITNIRTITFVFYSWISMLPATCAVVMSCDMVISAGKINYKFVLLLTLVVLLVVALTKLAKRLYYNKLR